MTSSRSALSVSSKPLTDSTQSVASSSRLTPPQRLLARSSGTFVIAAGQSGYLADCRSYDSTSARPLPSCRRNPAGHRPSPTRRGTDLSEEEILEGLESPQAYSTLSIDSSGGGDDDSEPSSLTGHTWIRGRRTGRRRIPGNRSAPSWAALERSRAPNHHDALLPKHDAGTDRRRGRRLKIMCHGC